MAESTFDVLDTRRREAITALDSLLALSLEQGYRLAEVVDNRAEFPVEWHGSKIRADDLPYATANWVSLHSYILPACAGPNPGVRA